MGFISCSFPSWRGMGGEGGTFPPLLLHPSQPLRGSSLAFLTIFHTAVPPSSPLQLFAIHILALGHFALSSHYNSHFSVLPSSSATSPALLLASSLLYPGLSCVSPGCDLSYLQPPMSLSLPAPGPQALLNSLPGFIRSCPFTLPFWAHSPLAISGLPAS